MTDLLPTLERMRRFGGHFCTQLANTAAAADPGNRQRLLAAFPELFEKYGPTGPFADNSATHADLIVLHPVGSAQP